jgi:hypothetical protein
MLGDIQAQLGTTASDLLTAGAVRGRAHAMLGEGRAGRLPHFDVRADLLPAAAIYVADTVRKNYPGLRVPPHARWRHFVVGGVDRWEQIARSLHVGPEERARIRIDLAVTSVLLDAGAGPEWRWRDEATGRPLTRSEGLAIASMSAFKSGLFSSDPHQPLRADAGGLGRLTADGLAPAFQVTTGNPLDGLEGRVELLRRLGEASASDPNSFGAAGRVGCLYDRIEGQPANRGGGISAPAILAMLLQALGTIWPGRITLDGLALGDTWRHPAIKVAGPTNGLMPIHKLSQWLAYSLIEPLEEAGMTVTDLDGLTGLAEYRNGGLFIDLGVLVPRQRDLLATSLQPGDEPIVEWRALTIALLDRLAPLVRAELGVPESAMPLASVLEGGTWAAGRRIARERRADGTPPIRIVSDGSVF